MKGMVRKAIQATLGARTKKMAPMTTTVVMTWMMSLAPTSRKRSSWLMSSLRMDMRPPVLRSSK
jgi:hypothetical protein